MRVKNSAVANNQRCVHPNVTTESLIVCKKIERNNKKFDAYNVKEKK